MLIPALDWYIGDFERRTGVVCSFENADVPHLNDLQTTAVYRIVQESLTNVARHALATHVKIFLQGQDGMLALTVEDDGGGFDIKNVLSWNGKSRISVNGLLIKQVRTHFHRDHNKLRIVLDLKPFVDYVAEPLYYEPEGLFCIAVGAK